MEYSVHKAAEFIRNGNHAGAEEAIASLQSTSSLDEVISLMKTDTSTQESTYVHFVLLKLLKIFLVRQRQTWVGNRAAVVEFLVNYANSLDARVLSQKWRPAAGELSSCVAVVLKLGCVTPDMQVCDGEVRNVVQCLVDGSMLPGSAAHLASSFLHGVICQRTVEEFGLFDATSRHRGLPVSAHRQARVMFEGEGSLAVLAQSLLQRVVAVAESGTTDPNSRGQQATVDATLGAVVACLAWPSHRFFEEESASDESCTTFTVRGQPWDSLFFSPFGAGRAINGSGGVDLFSHLSSWYGTQSVRGIPVARQRIAEVAQLLCSFKGGLWGSQESVLFLTASFSLCMNIFENIAVTSDQADFHLLPVLANSLLLLVSNFTEHIVSSEMVQLLGKFTDMTLYLIAWDAKGDDENVMSSLDETLSAWFQLSAFLDRGGGRGAMDGSTVAGAGAASLSSRDVLRRSCVSIFTKYLECKVAACVVDEDEGGFADAFTNSHLELIAHIGRVSACESCGILVAALQGVAAQVTGTAAGGSFAGSGSKGLDEATAMRLNEAVWLLVKVTSFFVADKAEGEDASIPRCFQAHESAAALVHLVEALMSSAAALLSPHTGISSPAVYTSYAEALHAYCRSFVEPEEETAALFATALGGGAAFVAFALQFAVAALQNVPLEKDAMDALCALLDGIANKSSAVRAFVVKQDSFHVVACLAAGQSSHAFVGHTRGRLLGFVLSCSGIQGSGSATNGASLASGLGPSAQVGAAALDSILTAAARRESSVNQLLECLTTVAGLYESAKRQDVIRALFAPMLSVAHNLLTSSFAKFSERELAIEAVQCVHNMFAASVLLLENQGILSLLQLVQAVEVAVSQSLKTTSTWQGSADTEVDRATLLSWTAKLLTAVSQWKLLDCFLSDEDVAAVAASTVSTLAVLLDCLDQRTLCFPELEEALFAALEVCSEASPTLVVLSPHFSATFSSATRYALTSDRATIQRAGVAVANHAADCLGGAASGHAAAGAGGGAGGLLQVLLRSLAAGRVQARNVGVVAKTVLKLAGCAGSMNELNAAFGGVARELPGSEAFLERLLAAVAASLEMLAATPHASSAAAHKVSQLFEDQLQDDLSLMRGTSLV